MRFAGEYHQPTVYVSSSIACNRFCAKDRAARLHHIGGQPSTYGANAHIGERYRITNLTVVKRRWPWGDLNNVPLGLVPGGSSAISPSGSNHVYIKDPPPGAVPGGQILLKVLIANGEVMPATVFRFSRPENPEA